MRYTNDHKAETRAKVIKAAAREIRAKGPDGIAVAGIMAQVGLTHGGFYAHFPSKDALIEASLDEMFRGARERSEPITGEDDPRATLNAYLDFYLSRAHRDARDRGCPLPALSGDFARGDTAGGARFSAGIETLAERLASALARIGIADADVEATSMLSELVGAVVLARAVKDADRSDAILARVRSALGRRYGLDDCNN